MRALTIVNLSLWTVLFMAWLPYAITVGWADPISSEVRWILGSTAVMLALLGFLRIRRRQPILG